MKNIGPRVKWLMIAGFAGLLAGTGGRAAAKPLKVYILAGQSNMQGHANVLTFDSMADDPKTAPILKEMRNADGTPLVLDKVWISQIGCLGDRFSDLNEQTGKLKAGFGASENEIGPEFTFGIYMEKRLKEPILIIKTAWGGRDLASDFRPPSAGPLLVSQKSLDWAKQHNEDLNELRDRVAKAQRGVFYRHMIEHVRKVLGDIKRVVPDYDPKQGYELAGFVWFQGFNDYINEWTYEDRDQPGGYSLYAKWLTMFIRDVRKDLSAPIMPFVIGVMGIDGMKPGLHMQHFRAAMAAPAALPEFKGNVVAVETAPFWDDDLGSLQARAEKGEKLTPEEEKRLKAGVSNGGYHYLGAAKIMAPIGKAFAEAIMNFNTSSQSAPVSVAKEDVKVVESATGLRVTSSYLDVVLSRKAPAFDSLGVDSLGSRKDLKNLLRASANQPTPYEVRRDGEKGKLEYRRSGLPAGAAPTWTIEVTGREIRLESKFSKEAQGEPLVLDFDNTRCHATLLGVMKDGSVTLPAVLHIPGYGTFHVTASDPNQASLGYALKEHAFVNVAFPPATEAKPVVTYRLTVAEIHPPLVGLEKDARFDPIRRNWLDALQLNPESVRLANHAASDTCAMCYYEFADIALYAPRSADGWSAMSSVRQTLDAMLAGGEAYGTPNHRTRWYPCNAADSLPAMLIAAYDMMLEGGDKDWIPKNYAGLRKWTEEMLATDKDGNGLIEYGLSGNSGSWPAQFKYRPSNWWDCIGFGHEDAYANALAYRALRNMAQIARHCGKNEDSVRYAAAADKLKTAYFKTFYNPATGVIAGWRSADGQLHDYYFMFVTGIAIHYGLVPKDKANTIIDKMLAKMKEVGYTRFDLGLPGNLVSIMRKDFAEPEGNPRLGSGTKEDCSDGFQIYENGGATACFAYFTIAALYDLGRKDEADAILLPMINGIDKGEFEGFGPNSIMSNDWRTWDGTARGCEAFLCDNYYVMLAALARQHQLQKWE